MGIIEQFSNPQYYIHIVVLVLSLSIHEFSHAYAAYRLGDNTAMEEGRLSLNPLVHLEPIGAMLILIGAPIAWARPVPVNPYRFNYRYSQKTGMAITAAAGPLSNIILAVIASFALGIVTLLPLLNISSTVFYFLNLGFYSLYLTNIYLAVFNILPISPLDGSKVIAIFLPERQWRLLMRYEMHLSIFLLLLIFMGKGILNRILDTLATPFYYVIFSPIQKLFEYIYSLLI